MNEVKNDESARSEAEQLEPVVITLGQFEEWMRYTRAGKAFVFVKYKGRWVEVDAEDHGDHFMYLFYGSQNNALLSECITMVSVPLKPEL